MNIEGQAISVLQQHPKPEFKGDIPKQEAQDVQDQATELPCQCRTEGGPCRTEAGTPEAEVQVRGIVRVGPMRTSRDQFAVLENPDLAGVFRAEPPSVDWILVADESAEVTFLDLDAHHWRQPPAAELLAAYAAALFPQPEAWWVSHRKGLKAVYTGPHHRARAVAAALSAPQSLQVEIKRESRHPLSKRADLPGARCGPVAYNATTPDAPFEFRAVGRFTPEVRRQALEQLKMEAGTRHDHERCPIDPAAASDARQCVVVLDAGVYCHRCAGHGVPYRAGMRPGWFPFSAVIGHAATLLDEMADERVHWVHAELVLKHLYSNIGTNALHEAYRHCLVSTYGDTDPRIPMVFNRDLDVVRGDGLWLDAHHYRPTTVEILFAKIDLLDG